MTGGQTHRQGEDAEPEASADLSAGEFHEDSQADYSIGGVSIQPGGEETEDSAAMAADDGDDPSGADSALTPRLLDELIEVGLFDPDWYRRRYRDVENANVEPAEHFLNAGAAENRWPNALFDPDWYVGTQLDGVPVRGHPVLHYRAIGEETGLKPSPFFDPKWYRDRYLAPFEGLSPLGHYIKSRQGGRHNPNAWFDVAFYLHENPDVRKSGMDPFEHFLRIGQSEGRNPSAHFDVAYYRRRYLANSSQEPFQHYVETGRMLGYDPDPHAEPAPAVEIRRYSRPSEHFENFRPEIVGDDPERLAKLIALYLPQFHSFPENDEWWGSGFTEWTNLARGTPRFAGHYQPRVPRDLGFYDLRDPNVMRRQVELARRAGLYGFCFYYYNFNGKRLMHQPVEEFLETPDIDWPFCIMWANENWSRRWDGSESEVLIRQDYLPEDTDDLVDDLARHFRDKRYIRINGRPLFMTYRAGIIPNVRDTVELWRKLFRERHNEDPIFLMAQTFTDFDPESFGFDGAVEFPPHRLMSNVHPRNPKITLYDQSFAGIVYEYDDVVKASGEVPVPDFPLVRTVFPSWDNDSRRQGRGVTFMGSTPAKYQDWLEQAIAFSRANPLLGENVVIINAWNEWAEGAYLEPDVHFGSAYLNATARAVVPGASSKDRYPVIVVTAGWGNERIRYAVRDFAAVARRDFGCHVHLVTLDADPQGSSVADFASVHHIRKPADLKPTVERLAVKGTSSVIVFSTATGRAVESLKDCALKVIVVVGELPVAITLAGADHGAHAIARHADIVITRSASVRDSFDKAFGPVAGTQIVRPAPLPQPPVRHSSAKTRLLKKFGLGPETRLVINAGRADLNTGADLFAAVARIVIAGRDDVAFVWLGPINPSLKVWLESGGGSSKQLQFRSDEDVRATAVADVVAFTAREDADGRIVADAVAAGIPVVAFDGSGTGADLTADARGGRLATFGDVSAFADRIIDALDNGIGALPASGKERSIKALSTRQDDAFALLSDADPALHRISLVMPAAGGANLDEALVGAFAQRYPAFEIITMSSSEKSEDRILDKAATNVRAVRVIDQPADAGPLEIIRIAAAAARGDLVCFLPAGKAAREDFVATLLAPLDDEETIAAIVADSGKAGSRRTSSPVPASEAEDGSLARGMMWRRNALMTALRTPAVKRPGDLLSAEAHKGRVAYVVPSGARSSAAKPSGKPRPSGKPNPPGKPKSPGRSKAAGAGGRGARNKSAKAAGSS